MLLAEKRMVYDYESVSRETVSNRAKTVRRQRHMADFLVKVGGVVLCLLVLNTLIQALVIQKTYEIRGLEAKVRDIDREIVEVRMDMANLESLDRIKTIAQNDLGMREAGSSDYRCIAVARPSLKSFGNSREESVPSNNLLAKVASWVGGLGVTMAQNR